MLIDINGPPMPPGFIGYPNQPPMNMPGGPPPPPNVQPFSYPSMVRYHPIAITVFLRDITSPPVFR